MKDYKPQLTVLIPIFNEDDILEREVQAIYSGLLDRYDQGDFEFILIENGSTDQSLEIAKNFARTRPEIFVIHLPKPSYGDALRKGISTCRGSHTFFFNIDFWDLQFVDKAMKLLEENDLVIGSKNMHGAEDRRPFPRRLITLVFNQLLCVFFEYEFTDTHGIKAISTKWAKILSEKCVTHRELFDTEMIIRANMENLRIKEIPISVSEIRPSRYSILSRVPSTLIDFLTLLRKI